MYFFLNCSQDKTSVVWGISQVKWTNEGMQGVKTGGEWAENPEMKTLQVLAKGKECQGSVWTNMLVDYPYQLISTLESIISVGIFTDDTFVTFPLGECH